jgi:hypothetical protein
MLKNVLAWLNLNEFNWLENKSMVKAVKLCVCVCFALNPSPARASARTGVVLSWFELWVS